VGATLLNEKVASAIFAGDHGSTYGGNLLACRAALVVLEALTTGGLMERVGQVGAVLEAGLRRLAERHPVIRDVRGGGLMWGLDLSVDAAPYIAAALADGILINRTSETVIRMLPPYVLSKAQAEEVVKRLDVVFKRVAQEAA
jgi:acetylornithine/succinyldiaminopimelate/putrescine aminotransferase